MSKHQISHHRIDGNLDSTPGSTRSDFRGHFEGREPCKPAQPVQPEVVTHVSGTFCHPCVRVGHVVAGGEGDCRDLCTAVYHGATSLLIIGITAH